MNVTRKISAGAIAALSIAGACVMAAAPAQAAAQTITTDCSTGDAIHIYARPGDTITIVMTSPDCTDIWNLGQVTTGALHYESTPNPGDYTPDYSYQSGEVEPDWYVTNSASPTTTVTTLLATQGASPGVALSPGDQISVIEGSNFNAAVIWEGLEAPAAGGSTPPPWFQSHGRIGANDTCEAGWSSSWAQWPNGGTGGFVCNRVVAYDSASGTWINQ